MIKKWVLKAIVQKTISYLPYKHSINHLFQKYVTKGVYLDTEYFEDRLGHAQNHIGWYEETLGSLEGRTTFELGCGWYPVVPLSMFLRGADNIFSIDISPLMNKDTFRTTLLKFNDYYLDGRLERYYSPKEDRMDVLLKTLNEYDTLEYSQILKRFNFTYFIEDLFNLNKISDHSIDLIHSNNTLEHIYPDILEKILTTFIRLGKKQNGVQSHFIDMSDHFAHFDNSITIYNFLKFSPTRWSLIDNSIQPQNRYRMSDYMRMYEKLKMPITQITHRPGSIENLRKVKLSSQFDEYTKEDLAISHCHVFSLFKE